MLILISGPYPLEVFWILALLCTPENGFVANGCAPLPRGLLFSSTDANSSLLHRALMLYRTVLQVMLNNQRRHSECPSLWQATLAFPAVLDRLALAPFDVAKLVHPFQAAAPALPAELNRHLFLLEERILEVCVQGSGYRLRSTI